MRITGISFAEYSKEQGVLWGCSKQNMAGEVSDGASSFHPGDGVEHAGRGRNRAREATSKMRGEPGTVLDLGCLETHVWPNLG